MKNQSLSQKSTVGGLWLWLLPVLLILFTACSNVKEENKTDQPDLPNPASVYCEKLGYSLEIVTAADGSQSGNCIFPDGSRCNEWAFYRGECAPAVKTDVPTDPSATSSPLPIDPVVYQGWWTYTSEAYGFSLMLPPDWVVNVSSNDPSPLQGHLLTLQPRDGGLISLRVTYRRVGEEVLLWPTGVGNGEFIPEGSLEVAGQPVVRIALVCPGGLARSFWYHQDASQPNIQRGGLEFGFILDSPEDTGTCQSGASLRGKLQNLGESIIASLKVQ